MEIKSQLLELLDWVDGEEHKLIEKLTPAQKTSSGDVQRWAIKDIVAHLAERQKRTYERLEATLRGEKVVESRDRNAINAETFFANRQESFVDLQAKLEEYNQKMRNLVASISEEDLTDLARYTYNPGRPLWTGVTGTGVIHVVGHLSSIYLENNQVAEAMRLQETATQRLLKIDQSPRWRGTMLYNLACFHALAGHRAEAIDMLRESLQLRDDLHVWSRQDPDLLALHGDPLYEALY